MNMQTPIDWKECHFDQLAPREVYQIAKLRIDVFVVEQNCPYAELDGKDMLAGTVHVIGRRNELPVAYARVLAPGYADADGARKPDMSVHIGRVVVKDGHRRKGLATALMHRVLSHCERHFTGYSQVLCAQVSVHEFYAGLGFATCSKHYLEDGIAHVNMIRRVTD